MVGGLDKKRPFPCVRRCGLLLYNVLG
jgi:hypothetical protein